MRSELWVVMSPSFVMTSSIFREVSFWKRRSRLVTMPISVRSAAMTGMPPMRCSFMRRSASPTVFSLKMVTGS